MQIFKYNVQTVGNNVTSVVTNDPNPKLKEGDLFGVQGETAGPMQELKVLKNTEPFPYVRDIEVRLDVSLPRLRLYTFTVLDLTPFTPNNKKVVYALVDVNGDIVDDYGEPTDKNIRTFKRKSDATNSMYQNHGWGVKDMEVRAFNLVPVKV